MNAGRDFRAVGRALTAMILAGVLAGCGGRETQRTPEPARLRYVAEHAQKSYWNCTGGGNDCTRIKLRWPVFTTAPGSPAVDSLNQFVRVTLLRPYDGGAILPSEDSVMVSFIDAYHAFAGSVPGGPTGPWQFERRIEVMGDTLGVASLAVSEEAYLGGAHPNSTTRFANFDQASGRRLRRSDLFRESARDSLDAVGERAFRRVRKLAPDADLGAAGYWFEGGRFRLNDNLAVTATGLLCFFNSYEVAPYALGATSISMPWAEVMPLARPDGPLASHRHP